MNFYLYSFIHIAIETGKTSVFKTLIEIINQFDLNAVLNLQNENKENCLHIACINNKSAYIAELIKSGKFYTNELTISLKKIQLHLNLKLNCRL
jgi:ankyrin repeat protein